MNTKIKAIGSSVKGLEMLKLMRSTPLNQWFTTPSLNDRLSGSLKKAHRLGAKINDQLRQEALAQTLGWTWESVQSSYLTFNDAVSEGDNHSLTEAGWFADRWLAINLFDEDFYEYKYIIISNPDGSRREGVGLICRETSIQWVQPGSLIFCIIAEYDVNCEEWNEAKNPF